LLDPARRAGKKGEQDAWAIFRHLWINMPGRRLAMQIQSGEKFFDVIVNFLAGDSQ
jgi:hypothetical protein